MEKESPWFKTTKILKLGIGVLCMKKQRGVRLGEMENRPEDVVPDNQEGRESGEKGEGRENQPRLGGGGQNTAKPTSTVIAIGTEGGKRSRD